MNIVIAWWEPRIDEGEKNMKFLLLVLLLHCNELRYTVMNEFGKQLFSSATHITVARKKKKNKNLRLRAHRELHAMNLWVVWDITFFVGLLLRSIRIYDTYLLHLNYLHTMAVCYRLIGNWKLIEVLVG
mmetsp:Transcript_43941/g.78869  ORF Transcript_43941/g.78869 Transcript_43941/m.78869 type:complete len:129 (+) Transcript_43941:704-1090(+)